jgi:hypothetical protein
MEIVTLKTEKQSLNQEKEATNASNSELKRQLDILRAEKNTIEQQIASLFKKIQTGSGYSIRPDLGEINGMVDFTGYSDKNPPVYIGKLLSYVSSSI